MRLSIDTVREVGAAKGFTLLSDKYLDCFTDLEWRCPKGHKFKECYDTVRTRKNVCRRCPTLYKTTPTLEKMQEIATERGGEVLSRKYLTGGKKMHFKCKNGHNFWTQPYEIKKGTWCRKCFSERIAKKYKYSIEFIHKFAESKDGKCLSTEEEYKNSFSNLKWECAKGHRFKSSYHITKRRKNFCKKCAGV